MKHYAIIQGRRKPTTVRQAETDSIGPFEELERALMELLRLNLEEPDVTYSLWEIRYHEEKNTKEVGEEYPVTKRDEAVICPSCNDDDAIGLVVKNPKGKVNWKLIDCAWCEAFVSRGEAGNWTRI